jgi:linoleoyl-CoA desaturase
LLSNAIKYRSSDRVPEIYLKTEKVDGRIEMSVKDSGLGVAEDKINLLFTPYSMVYYTLFIILPVIAMDITWRQFLVGFLAMNLSEGLVMGLIFQLAPLVEETDMPLLKANKNVEEAWAAHQMRTTANFARNSKVSTFLFGGLNYQVEHHLFPKICHTHQPAISEIVKQTPHEFNLPYHENESFYSTMKSPYLFLKQLGRQPEVNPSVPVNQAILIRLEHRTSLT